MSELPPSGRSPGPNVLLLLILLILIAGFAAWGWMRNPPDTPNPSATAAPPAVPGGDAPSQ